MVIQAYQPALIALLAIAILPAAYAIANAALYAWRGRHKRRAVRAGMRKRERAE